MFNNFPLFPHEASSVAGQVDALYFLLLAISGFFAVAISIAVVFFAIKYRRRHALEVGAKIHGSTALEILWSAVPLAIVMGIFVWSSVIYIRISRPPANAMDVYVVGKQWMWKIQHPDGRREINELHVPVGRPVRLTLASEDVIHDFFVPAFRVKADVVPGRFTTLWFEATKPGRYHFFCAQYCGTEHSGMIGWVDAMTPEDFQAWVAAGAGESLASSGEKLFEQLSCNSCHRPGSNGRGPVLEGIYGKPVALQGGGQVIADDSYLRESIVDPQARTVAGYQPIMPTFQGLVTEEGLLQLVAYIKSLGTTQQTVPAPGAPPVADTPHPAGRQ
jgi:cytochrome c oxidase subunit 2